MDGFDDDDDGYVAQDFQLLVGHAQYNELVEEEKRRIAEREATQALIRQAQPQFKTLPQILGLKSQAEIDKAFGEQMAKDEAKSAATEAKEKEEANARLTSKFPAPIITTE